MPDTTVKFFDYEMSGAPGLTGEAGSLISLLDACLINGFGSVTLDSLSVSGDVATGTISTGHGFEMLGNAGPVIKIEGATPSALNGEWRLASVPTSTTFTFATSGVADGSASGTITAKRAPAGWEKTYSGTNKAAYSRTSLDATSMLLRVDDTNAQYATLTMYETMSDVDTGTGAATTVYMAKSSTANTTERHWTLFADAHTMYAFANPDNGVYWYAGMLFGDILSLKSSDAYHCAIMGAPATPWNDQYEIHLLNGLGAGMYLARSYTQTGVFLEAKRYGHQKQPKLGDTGMTVNPNPVNNALYVTRVEVWEGTSLVRGFLPGLFNPVHDYEDLDHGSIVDHANGTWRAQTNVRYYRALMELSNPWR